jgi:hypothetical protein
MALVEHGVLPGHRQLDMGNVGYDHLSEESAFGDLSPDFTNDIVEPRIAYDPKHLLQNVTIEVEEWN